MKSITELKNLKGKYVLVRADFNVPIKNNKILDPFRIEKARKTLTYLTKQGARVIVLSHAGSDGTQSLKPIADYLSRTFTIIFSPEIIGKQTLKLKENLKNGQVLLLENIRRERGEMENGQPFTRALSQLASFYVNDAFPVCHRVHASIVGIPKQLPSYAGFQLEEEIKHLSLVFSEPKHPFLFILGGAKFETKLPLIKRYLKTADNLFIGGALANQVFKEIGYETGISLVENKTHGIPRLLKNTKISIPQDVEVIRGAKHPIIAPNILDPKDNMIDIGPETIALLAPQIHNAKLILWNGPVGTSASRYNATKKILDLIATSKAISIIGGGDTVEVISEYKMADKFTFVSSGGGATLEFLAKGTLPGIKALK